MYWWWFPEWSNGSAYRSSRCGHDPVEPAGPDVSRPPGLVFGLSPERSLVLLVARALLDDPAVTGGPIEIDVQNGVVILDGDVDTEAASFAAAERAWAVPGVVDVCNALRVSSGRHQPQEKGGWWNGADESP